MELYRAEVFYERHPKFGSHYFVRYCSKGSLRLLRKRLRDEYREFDITSLVVISEVMGDSVRDSYINGGFETLYTDRDMENIKRATFKSRRDKINRSLEVSHE